uniref:Secreted protein n=1 Tax=Rhipicephalus appendiculatus TaxID=34631 RepID=A0A131YCU8_RHIAP
MPSFMLCLGTSRLGCICATVTSSARWQLLLPTVAGGTVGGSMAPSKQNLMPVAKRCMQRLACSVRFKDTVWGSFTCTDTAQYTRSSSIPPPSKRYRRGRDRTRVFQVSSRAP